MSVNLNTNQAPQANIQNFQQPIPQTMEQAQPQVEQSQVATQSQQVDAQTYLAQLPNAESTGYVPQVTDAYNQTQNQLPQAVVNEEQPASNPIEPSWQPNVVEDQIVEDWPKPNPQNTIYGPKPYAMPEINVIEPKKHVITSDKAAVYTGICVSCLALLISLVAKFRRG